MVVRGVVWKYARYRVLMFTGALVVMLFAGVPVSKSLRRGLCTRHVVTIYTSLCLRLSTTRRSFFCTFKVLSNQGMVKSRYCQIKILSNQGIVNPIYCPFKVLSIQFIVNPMYCQFSIMLIISYYDTSNYFHLFYITMNDFLSYIKTIIICYNYYNIIVVIVSRSQ